LSRYGGVSWQKILEGDELTILKEAEAAFADVEEPLEDDDDDEMEMVYDEGEYGSDESQEDDPAVIDVETAGDVDLHGDETDPEDEDILGEEDHEHEHDEDEESESGSEDTDSLSEHPDEPQGDLNDGIWQVRDNQSQIEVRMLILGRILKHRVMKAGICCNPTTMTMTTMTTTMISTTG
jgi:hypothetical protein